MKLVYHHSVPVSELHSYAVRCSFIHVSLVELIPLLQWQLSEVIAQPGLSRHMFVYLFLLQSLLKTASPNGDEMLLNGMAPLPGQIIKLPNLAQTFRELIANGKDGFYKGRIAQAIVDLVQSKGGVMELTDLAEHKSTLVEPIQYTYANEVTVYEVRSRLGAANTFDTS